MQQEAAVGAKYQLHRYRRAARSPTCWLAGWLAPAQPLEPLAELLFALVFFASASASASGSACLCPLPEGAL